MQENKQARKPMAREERDRVMKEALLKHEAEHQQKMKTDPTYRKMWEKREADFKKIALLNDSIEKKPIPNWEEHAKKMKEVMEEHRQRLETDEEYRKGTEKARKFVEERMIFFKNDTER